MTCAAGPRVGERRGARARSCECHLTRRFTDSAMNATYDAASIEVLAGLDPVRKRPGMYTDIARPNHLAQEVIDNSVDEAIVGQANRLAVVLHADDSLTVVDDGRGMPVDIHPEEGIPGVELILTRLHAGGKFSPGKLPVFGWASRGRGVRRQCAVATPRGTRETRRLRICDGVRKRREGGRARRGRLGRAPEHGNDDSLLARCPILRLSKVFHSAAPPHPACQGGALPGTAGVVRGGSDRRKQRVALRGRPECLSRGCARGGRRRSAISVRRKHGGQYRGGGLGGSVAARGRGGARRELRQPDPHDPRGVLTSTASGPGSWRLCASTASSATCSRGG